MSGITGAAQVYADWLQVWSAGRKSSGTFVRTARFQALLQRMHDASTPSVCMKGWLRAKQLEARHDGVDCLAVIKSMKKDFDEKLERQSSPL